MGKTCFREVAILKSKMADRCIGAPKFFLENYIPEDMLCLAIWHGLTSLSIVFPYNCSLYQNKYAYIEAILKNNMAAIPMPQHLFGTAGWEWESGGHKAFRVNVLSLDHVHGSVNAYSALEALKFPEKHSLNWEKPNLSSLLSVRVKN